MQKIPDSTSRKYARKAFEEHFESLASFDEFVAQISSDEKRDKFLYVGTIYLFLVKCGDWNVRVEDSNPVIDYITNSYKLVTLFSLIESLSTDKHIEFFEWLNARARKSYFPLDRQSFREKYEEYKEDYGSIRKFKAFFDALPNQEKKSLVESFKFKNGETTTIGSIASYLYNLRSKFVHEAEVILELGTAKRLVREKNSYILVDLPLQEFMGVFESGVVEYFKAAPDTEET